ncbi:MAG TPA: hypothetical protein VJ922_00465, partial [Actinomycetota bacterium]|nr:hypothetical protein [Actinomycetota bacterium]
MPRRSVINLFIALALFAAGTIPLALAADCAKTSTGLVPLTDLGTDSYKGRQGGLYPGGSNKRPSAHTGAGISLIEDRVRPRKADGTVDTNKGKLVFLSVGMSNAEAEFQYFINVADADDEKSPRVVVVNGAQAGQEASEAAVEGRKYWDVVDARLAAAGVTGRQVGAIWLKQADGSPGNKPFAEHVDT